MTDACVKDWKTFRNLEWLEITSCPYVKFTHPTVNFLKPPPKLRTLRLSPRSNGGGGGNQKENETTISARDFLQLVQKSEVVRRSFSELKNSAAGTRPSVFVGDRPKPPKRKTEGEAKIGRAASAQTK